MKPDPDNNFCLKFCILHGKVDDQSTFNFPVVDLILYLELYLDLINVFAIWKWLNFLD